MCCDTQTEAATVAVGDGYPTSETARSVHIWKINIQTGFACVPCLRGDSHSLLIPPTPALRDGVLNIISLSGL